jgi:hypothetical protein
MNVFEVEQASRGGAPLFQPFHLLKALWIAEQKGPLGRADLAELVGVGEGSVRKLLAHMESKGWVSTARQGISLAGPGESLLKEIGLRAKEVHAGNITVADVDFAVMLKNLANKVGNGIEQRDEAIKAGASGATTLVFRDRLVFADGFEAEKVDKKAARVLKQDFRLAKGDVLIIGCSPDPDKAADGAFAAAVLTLGKEK